MMKRITATALVKRIRAEVAEVGSQEALAARCGVSGAYLSYVLNGQRPPSKKILDALGYRRVVLYEQL